MYRADYEHVDNPKGDAGQRLYDSGRVKYEINLDRSTTLWVIKPTIGALPKDLEGTFTAPQYAVTAIKNYTNKKAKP